MRNNDDIKELLDYFQNTGGTPLRLDEEAIISAYRKDEGDPSLPTKILSILGGILASLAFLGFLLAAGLYDSDVGLLIAGGIFIVGSIGINKAYDNTIMDTVTISSFILGFTLLGLGCGMLNLDENIISVIFILIALGSLSVVRNYVLSFVSILIINGSILCLIISNEAYNFIHVHVSALALIMTYFFLKEAAIITTNKTLLKLYNPARAGLIVSFLSGLVFLGKEGILPVSPAYIWLSSIVVILAILYLIHILFHVFNITETRHKAGMYIFAVLALLPTALSPAISGAILVILLSFLVNYKTGLALSMISFIYFISQYYYDLNFTLLTKSMLLFSTGVLFIALYLFTYKKLTANEKV